MYHDPLSSCCGGMKSTKAIETDIILLKVQVAAVIFVNKRSLILAHLKYLYQFTKSFQKFQLLPGAANC